MSYQKVTAGLHTHQYHSCFDRKIFPDKLFRTVPVSKQLSRNNCSESDQLFQNCSAKTVISEQLFRIRSIVPKLFRQNSCLGTIVPKTTVPRQLFRNNCSEIVPIGTIVPEQLFQNNCSKLFRFRNSYSGTRTIVPSAGNCSDCFGGTILEQLFWSGTIVPINNCFPTAQLLGRSVAIVEENDLDFFAEIPSRFSNSRRRFMSTWSWLKSVQTKAKLC